MALEDRRKKKSQAASTISEIERIVAGQVPANRREEILEYLKLFGYKPDRTILQVHIAGFFGRRSAGARAAEKRAATAKRYGGTTFVVVGRTHDPSIMDLVIKPRKKPEQASAGYVGYLWKNRDPQNRPPHEVVPLDFTPMHVRFLQDGKNMFATKSFMIALHVPASFAKDKNRLSRALYRGREKCRCKTAVGLYRPGEGRRLRAGILGPSGHIKGQACQGLNQPGRVRKTAPDLGRVIFPLPSVLLPLYAQFATEEEMGHGAVSSTKGCIHSWACTATMARRGPLHAASAGATGTSKK
ncbi:MAG TPA: hypothetical protein VGJ42_01540 [Nitrososphaera sp.]